jgi:hypothetical protein
VCNYDKKTMLPPIHTSNNAGTGMTVSNNRLVFKADEFNELGLLEGLPDKEPNKGSGRVTGNGTGRVPIQST